VTDRQLGYSPQTSPPPRARRRSCALIGCLVVVALVTIPGTVVWGVIAAGDDGRPDEPRHEVKDHVLPPGPGVVELHVRMAEIDISPGPPGSPLRLESDWNPGVFSLTEGLQQEGAGWRYRLDFGGRGLAFLRHHGHHEPNRLRLQIPVDHPLSIEGKLSMGQSDVDLGGLALDCVKLELSTGEHRLSFHQPTPQPLSLLELDSSMGELTVIGAGNASPRRIEVRHGMGELVLDLTGQWRADGDVDLRFSMGDSRVDLPRADEAAAIVEKAHVSLGDRSVFDTPIGQLPAGLPKVRVRASGGMGELRIR
jgi:hypothetical protein